MQPKITKLEASFLQATWDTLVDLSKDHTLAVGFVIAPTGRRGVFLLKCRASYTSATGKRTMAVEHSIEYPNASTMTLAAQMFQLATHVSNEADRWAKERAESAGD